MRALLLAAILCAAPLGAAGWALETCDAEELQAFVEGDYKLPSSFLDKGSPTNVREGARWRFEVQDGDSKRVITWQVTREISIGKWLYEIDNGRGLVFAFLTDNSQLADKAWAGKRGESPDEVNLYPQLPGYGAFSNYYLKVPLNISVLDMPAEATRRGKFTLAGRARDVITRSVRYLGVSYELTLAPSNEVFTALGLLEFKVQGKTVGKLIDGQSQGEVAPLLDWTGLFDITQTPEPFTPPARPTQRIFTENLGAAGTLVHVHQLLARVDFRDAKGKAAYPYGEPEYLPRPVLFPGSVVVPPGLTWEFWSGYRPGDATAAFDLIAQLRPFISKLFLENVLAEDVVFVSKMTWLNSLKLVLKRTQGKRGYLAPLGALKELAELELWHPDAIADLAWLEDLPKLRKLWLEGDNAAIGLPRLPHLTQLREVAMGYVELSDEILTALSAVNGLEKLVFHDCDFRGLTEAASLAPQTLQRLEIWSGKEFNEKVLSSMLAPCVNELNLVSLEINNDMLAVAARNPNLTKLELSRLNEVDDEGLALIATLGRLEKLELIGLPKVTDEGLAALRHLEALKDLRLDDWGPEVTGAFIGELKQNLEKAYLRGVYPAGKHLRSLGRMTNLRELTIYSCVGGVELGTDLAAFLGSLKSLTTLSLVGIGVANNDTLFALKGTPALKALRVCYAGALTDKGIEALPGLSRLESLCIQQCLGVSRGGVSSFKRLASLRKLLVWKCGEFQERDISELRAALAGCECEILP